MPWRRQTTPSVALAPCGAEAASVHLAREGQLLQQLSTFAEGHLAGEIAPGAGASPLAASPSHHPCQGGPCQGVAACPVEESQAPSWAEAFPFQAEAGSCQAGRASPASLAAAGSLRDEDPPSWAAAQSLAEASRQTAGEEGRAAEAREAAPYEAAAAFRAAFRAFRAGLLGPCAAAAFRAGRG